MSYSLHTHTHTHTTHTTHTHTHTITHYTPHIQIHTRKNKTFSCCANMITPTQSTSTGTPVHYSGAMSHPPGAGLVIHRRLCYVSQVKVCSPEVLPALCETWRAGICFPGLHQVHIDVTAGWAQLTPGPRYTAR